MPVYISRRPPARSYNSVILGDGPAGFWDFNGTTLTDLTAHANNATFPAGTPAATVMPNGDLAMNFNGSSQYATIPTQNYFSAAKSVNGGVSPGGILTIEAWIAPAVTIFPHETGSGYVWWAGKGTTSSGTGANQEWGCRMYGTNNTESPNRWNRISGYCFNPGGNPNLGVGAYFQVPAAAPVPVSPFPQWIYYVLVINTQNTSPTYTQGYVTIYRGAIGTAIGNSTPVDTNTQSLTGEGGIVPVYGTAPVRIGTRNLESYFEGAVGKFALYDFELTAAQVTAHYNAITPPRGAFYGPGPAAVSRSATW